MVSDLKSELKSPLIKAVFAGDLDEVQALIESNVDVNQQSAVGRIAPLHAAAHCSGNTSSQYNNFVPSLDFVSSLNLNEITSENAKNNKVYIDILRLLCQTGARVNCKDGKSLTPLHYACRANSDEAVQILLEYQADVNARDKNWQAPLHICAMYNSVDCCRLLLPLMGNIDVSDRLGRSALAHAAFNGNLEMVEFLLENGANPNSVDKLERRPLHWASYVGYISIIRLLVKHGAEINCNDKKMYTPLLVACASGKSEETVSLLIELGADPNATTIADSSVFHLACLNGHDQIVKELLNTHNLCMSLNNKGYHPIHFAAGCKQGAFCLELLVSLNVDVNLASFSDGRTPMHVAALQGRTSCAQILFSNGASVNCKDHDNNTPLHLAAMAGQTSMIEFLIECGANIFIQGTSGMLPWAMAALNGNSESFKYLIMNRIIPKMAARKRYFETKDDFGRTFMHLAAISGNNECLDLFIKTECHLNEPDKHGYSPLHYACAGSYLNCVQILLKAGANVNQTNHLLDTFAHGQNPNSTYDGGAPDEDVGITPLMLACAFDQDGLVVRELVLNAAARANIVDRNGFNTLHYAALLGNRNVFEIIVEQAKYLNQQDNTHALSPLHLLAYYGHKSALEFLLRNKICGPVDAKDVNGRTPLDLACFQGESTCAKCLMSFGARYDSHDSVNERTPLHAAAYNNNEECFKVIAAVEYDKLKRKLESADDGDSLDGNEEPIGDDELIKHYVEDEEEDDEDVIIDMNLHQEAGSANGNDNASDPAAPSDSIRARVNARLTNVRDKFQRTPLMVAVEQGHINTITFLISTMGADVLAVDEKRRSALHRAAALGYEECCVTILKANPRSVWLKDANGLLAIHYAVLAGHANLIGMFLEYHHMESNNFVLNKAPTVDVVGESTTDDDQVATPTPPAKAEPDRLVESNGFSLLHFACFHGHSTCAETICEISQLYPYLTEMLDPPTTSTTTTTTTRPVVYNRFSPLHCACLNSHDTCLAYLLDTFAERAPHLIELEDENLNRPLHVCAINNEVDCAQLLLESACELNAKNRHGHTPFMLAAAYNSFNVMEMLLLEDKEAKKSGGGGATNGGCGGASRHQVDLTCIDVKGNSALHLALLNGHENCALFILDRIVPSMSHLINHKNGNGQTPLHLAAAKGFSTVVEILLSKGADIWMRNARNQTPLVGCAKNEQVADCLELMLSRLIYLTTSSSASSQVQNAAAASSNTTSNMMIMMMTQTTPSSAQHQRNFNFRSHQHSQHQRNQIISNSSINQSHNGDENFDEAEEPSEGVLAGGKTLLASCNGATTSSVNEIVNFNLNDSSLLNTSDIILNDVNMAEHHMQSSSLSNLVAEAAAIPDAAPLSSTNGVDGAAPAAENGRLGGGEPANLNSTLIMNDEAELLDEAADAQQQQQRIGGDENGGPNSTGTHPPGDSKLEPAGQPNRTQFVDLLNTNNGLLMDESSLKKLANTKAAGHGLVNVVIEEQAAGVNSPFDSEFY